MTSDDQQAASEGEGSDIDRVFGSRPATIEEIAHEAGLKTSFAPWHLPVKQVVRVEQWKALVARLLQDRASTQRPLRYFTLPGPDLLDVRVVAEACQAANVKVDYFGFDGGARADATTGSRYEAPWVSSEAALRQAGHLTDSAMIYSDRLEDIAAPTSQAATLLSQRSPFDVVNIDACEHLAHEPTGRSKSTFDAVRQLLAHQLPASSEWLLFITTRVDPKLLGAPADLLRAAIASNLQIDDNSFGDSLADCLKVDRPGLDDAIKTAWTQPGPELMKTYAVGLAKFLMQYFHGQPNHPARVELVSLYEYRVSAQTPDMLAMAFRITPGALQIQEPSVGGPIQHPLLELKDACRAARRASRLWDIDIAIRDDADFLAEKHTADLLRSARFDTAKWHDWVNSHPRNALIPKH